MNYIPCALSQICELVPTVSVGIHAWTLLHPVTLERLHCIPTMEHERVNKFVPFFCYRANVQGDADDRITPHNLFKRLGKTVQARRDAYHSLFTEQLAENDLKVIRNALQTGTPLGSEKFKQQVEQKLQCKVGHDRRGRTKRASTP